MHDVYGIYIYTAYTMPGIRTPEWSCRYGVGKNPRETFLYHIYSEMTTDPGSVTKQITRLLLGPFCALHYRDVKECEAVYADVQYYTFIFDTHTHTRVHKIYKPNLTSHIIRLHKSTLNYSVYIYIYI